MLPGAPVSATGGNALWDPGRFPADEWSRRKARLEVLMP